MAEQDDTLDAVSEEMEGFIEARPLTALGLAVVLGALVGKRLFKPARQSPNTD